MSEISHLKSIERAGILLSTIRFVESVIQGYFMTNLKDTLKILYPINQINFYVCYSAVAIYQIFSQCPVLHYNVHTSMYYSKGNVNVNIEIC